MQPYPVFPPSPGDPVPQILRDWLQALRSCFTAPSWEHVLVLVMGAVLAPGKRTVSACLRMTGRAEARNFSSYHQLLNRARWDSRAMARCLLAMIIDRLVPDGPVVIGMDDTIERRWGRRITARGIYRDPVRSSHGHFVKASGLGRVRQRGGNCGVTEAAPFQAAAVEICMVSGLLPVAMSSAIGSVCM